MRPESFFIAVTLSIASVTMTWLAEPVLGQQDGRRERAGRDILNRGNLGRSLTNRWPYAHLDQAGGRDRNSDQNRDVDSGVRRSYYGYISPYHPGWYYGPTWNYGRNWNYGRYPWRDGYYRYQGGNGYRLPNYYVPGYGLGYGYGLGGFVPGAGVGIGLDRLFGPDGVYFSPDRSDQGFSNDDFRGGGNYSTGYGMQFPGTSHNSSPVAQPLDTMDAGDYLERARAAFLAADYTRAQRLAHHAIIEDAEQAKAHELMSLAFFAQENYSAAAEAAHAAIHFGPVADWPTLYRYYNDRDKYEQHFNALKQFVKARPESTEGQFMLGLHLLIMGHRESARARFAQYLKIVDYRDPVGIQLFSEAGGDVQALARPIASPAASPNESREGT